MIFADGSSITQTEGGTVIEGREAIGLYRILVLKQALHLESHGIKVQRGFSALQCARDLFGINFPRGDKGRTMAIAQCELVYQRALREAPME